MGFLDNLKKEERTKEEVLAEFNIFEGIECKVTFPFTELKIGSHGGAARGAATLAFGIVGLAATSGVKHKEERKEMKRGSGMESNVAPLIRFLALRNAVDACVFPAYGKSR